MLGLGYNFACMQSVVRGHISHLVASHRASKRPDMLHCSLHRENSSSRSGLNTIECLRFVKLYCLSSLVFRNGHVWSDKIKF